MICFVIFLIEVSQSQMSDTQDLFSQTKQPYMITLFNQALCSYDFYDKSLGNGICNDYLNTKECSWDLGDCGYCSRNCYFYMLNNKVCDKECFTEECEFDHFDCLDSSEFTGLKAENRGFKRKLQGSGQLDYTKNLP